MDYHVYLVILALVAIDYLSGICGAVMEGSFSSTKMREGLFHKMTYFVAIAVCWLIEYASVFLDLGLVYSAGITGLVCTWIAVTEVGSILENIVRINPGLGDNAFMALFTKKGE